MPEKAIAHSSTVSFLIFAGPPLGNPRPLPIRPTTPCSQPSTLKASGPLLQLLEGTSGLHHFLRKQYIEYPVISAIQGAIKSEGDWQRANREVNVTKCSSVHPIAKPCRTLPRNRHPLAPPVLSRLPRDDSSHFFREGRSQAIMSCLR